MTYEFFLARIKETEAKINEMDRTGQINLLNFENAKRKAKDRNIARNNHCQNTFDAEIAAYESKFREEQKNLTNKEKDLRRCEKQLRSISRYGVTAEQYDFEKLQSLLHKINDMSFSAGLKKVFHLSGYSSNARMSQECYEILQAGYALIDRKRLEAARVRDQEISNSADLYQKKKEQIKAEYEREKQKAEAEYDRVCRDLEAEKRKFWNSDRISTLGRDIRNTAFTGDLSTKCWKHYVPARKKSLEICLGWLYVPFQVSTDNYKKVQGQIGKGIAENGYICVPYVLPYGNSLRMWVEYEEKEREMALEGMRSLILRFVRSMPVGSFRISCLDPHERGTSIGRLEKLTETEGCPACYTPCASVDDSIKHLTMLRQEFDRRYSPCLAGNGSIDRYNEVAEEKLEYHIIIVNDLSEYRVAPFYELLKVMVNNADKWGVSIVLLNCREWGQKEEQVLGENKELTHFRSLQGERFLHLEGKGKYFYDKGNRCIRFARPVGIEDSYLEEIVSEYKKGLTIENEFDRYICTDEKKIQLHDPYMEKGIRIPFAVGTDGKLVELELGTPGNAHAMVIGGTGAGKSTTLHAVIASLALKYHPDDVELWLIDYKFTEMKKYQGECWLPHIRLIGMDSEDFFSIGILKKCSDELAHRQRMMTGDIYQYEEERKRGLHAEKLPHIVVILDEYQTMIWTLAQNPEIRKNWENILRIARSLGMYFLLSSQTATKLLTSGESMQVAGRMFMRIEDSKASEERMELFGMQKGEEKDKIERLCKGLGAGMMVYKYNLNVGHGVYRAEYKKVRALYLSDDYRKSLLPVIRKMSVYGQYVPKRMLCYEGRVRKKLDQHDIVMDERDVGFVNGVIPQEREKIILYLGTPVGPSFYTRLFLEESKNENILLIGRNRKLQYCILRGIIESYLRKTGQDKDQGEVVLLAAEFAQIYVRFMREWQELSKKKERFRIVSDMKGICREVHEISEVVKGRRQCHKLVIILGLSEIVDEMSRCPKEYSAGLRQGLPEKQPIFENRRLDVQERRKDLEEKRRERIERIRELAKEGDAELNAESGKLFSLGENLKTASPFERLLHDSVPPFEGVGKAAGQQGGSMESYLYDGRGDIQNLLAKQGGIFGIHMVITADNYNEIKGMDMKDYNGLCRHKVACGLTQSDYSNLFGTIKVSDKLDSNTAVYHDGESLTYFLPFLYLTENE